VLRLHPSALDIVLLSIYFVAILGIGFAARRSVGTSADFLLAGRSLPAWVTGLAFISANLGATEILGMAANGAQYGVATVHYYWIGAVPAMVFLGVVMMPFYFRSKARSVPEFLRVRFNDPTHVLNAVVFALSAVLIAGVNLYALAIVLQSLLGVNLYVGIIVSAAFVLAYIGAGGLSSAIYGEVLQFFIILAGLIPLTIAAVKNVGGLADLGHKVITAFKGNDNALHAWGGTGIGVSSHNPIGADFIGIIFGLGFVLSFGYWTTNFAEVQRALSAKDESAGRRTPLIAAYPKLVIPAVTVIPGLVALVTFKHFGAPGNALTYNDAIPALMGKLLPSGVLGIAITGLFASFMAGVAANVSSLNTVVTYDLLEPYVKKNRSDHYYLNSGRIVTVVGIVLAVFTAILASHFSNIMVYLQNLFSIFNSPIFATFIFGMFWKKTSAWAGFWGLLAGVVSGAVTFLLFQTGVVTVASAIYATFIQASVAFLVDIVVTLAVTAVTQSPDPATLTDIVYSRHQAKRERVAEPWWRRPVLLGSGALVIAFVLNLIFA
jgi:solute:Na+ symporter, SSS family